MNFAFILFVIIYFFFNYNFKNFYQFENMLIFTRLNNILLKKFNIRSSLILDSNYNIVRIIYKNKDLFTKTLELSEGSYDLAKIINNQ